MNSQKTQPHNYVSFIDDQHIVLRHVTPDVASIIRTYEGYKVHSEDEDTLVITVVSEQALNMLLSALQKENVLFVGGPAGWPPAEIFDSLREQGLLQGAFREVVWYGVGRWSIRER